MQRGEIEKRINELEKSIEVIAFVLFHHEHESPLSKHCERVLTSPPPCDPSVESMKKRRSWVMCRAFQLLENGVADDFREAVTRAWQEVWRTCGKL